MRSDDPNCQIAEIKVDGEEQIVLLALREVKTGDELTIAPDVAGAAPAAPAMSECAITLESVALEHGVTVFTSSLGDKHRSTTDRIEMICSAIGTPVLVNDFVEKPEMRQAAPDDAQLPLVMVGRVLLVGGFDEFQQMHDAGDVPIAPQTELSEDVTDSTRETVQSVVLPTPRTNLANSYVQFKRANTREDVIQAKERVIEAKERLKTLSTLNETGDLIVDIADIQNPESNYSEAADSQWNRQNQGIPRLQVDVEHEAEGIVQGIVAITGTSKTANSEVFLTSVDGEVDDDLLLRKVPQMSYVDQLRALRPNHVKLIEGNESKTKLTKQIDQVQNMVDQLVSSKKSENKDAADVVETNPAGTEDAVDAAIAETNQAGTEGETGGTQTKDAVEQKPKEKAGTAQPEVFMTLAKDGVSVVNLPESVLDAGINIDIFGGKYFKMDSASDDTEQNTKRCALTIGKDGEVCAVPESGTSMYSPAVGSPGEESHAANSGSSQDKNEHCMPEVFLTSVDAQTDDTLLFDSPSLRKVHTELNSGLSPNVASSKSKVDLLALDPSECEYNLNFSNVSNGECLSKKNQRIADEEETIAALYELAKLSHSMRQTDEAKLIEDKVREMQKT